MGGRTLTRLKSARSGRLSAEMSDRALIKVLSARALRETWNAVPATAHTQKIGDKWLRGNSTPALSVPSIHSATDRNILLNPAHPDASNIVLTRVDPYVFDFQLFNAPNQPKPRRRN
jgi:RES domain-containing protein